MREGIDGNGPLAMTPGAVRQPNHIRCVRTARYKLARYFDPAGQGAQEWELYDLHHDPNETRNLVEVSVTPPAARFDIRDREAVQTEADRLASLLERLERKFLL